VKAVFLELPAFEQHRDGYLDDDNFGQLQGALMANPAAGELIEGTGWASQAKILRFPSIEG